jgi:hypothetical protein
MQFHRDVEMLLTRMFPPRNGLYFSQLAPWGPQHQGIKFLLC